MKRRVGRRKMVQKVEIGGYHSGTGANCSTSEATHPSNGDLHRARQEGGIGGGNSWRITPFQLRGCNISRQQDGICKRRWTVWINEIIRVSKKGTKDATSESPCEEIEPSPPICFELTRRGHPRGIPPSHRVRHATGQQRGVGRGLPRGVIPLEAGGRACVGVDGCRGRRGQPPRPPPMLFAVGLSVTCSAGFSDG